MEGELSAKQLLARKRPWDAPKKTQAKPEQEFINIKPRRLSFSQCLGSEDSFLVTLNFTESESDNESDSTSQEDS